MLKIKRMLVKFRQLQRKLNREHTWDNLNTTTSYEVVVFDSSTKSSVSKHYSQLKEAVQSVYPSCKTMYNHEFYIFRKSGNNKNQFLKFCPHEA